MSSIKSPDTAKPSNSCPDTAKPSNGKVYEFPQAILATPPADAADPYETHARKAFVALPEAVRNDPTLVVIVVQYANRRVTQFKLGEVSYRSAKALSLCAKIAVGESRRFTQEALLASASSSSSADPYKTLARTALYALPEEFGGDPALVVIVVRVSAAKIAIQFELRGKLYRSAGELLHTYVDPHEARREAHALYDAIASAISNIISRMRKHVRALAPSRLASPPVTDAEEPPAEPKAEPKAENQQTQTHQHTQSARERLNERIAEALDVALKKLVCVIDLTGMSSEDDDDEDLEEEEPPREIETMRRPAVPVGGSKDDVKEIVISMASDPDRIKKAVELYGAYDAGAEGKHADIGARGANVDDSDKAFVSAVLERVFGLPDICVLLPHEGESGRERMARREMLVCAFQGTALIVRIWSTLSDLGIENVEDLIAHYKREGYGDEDVAELHELAVDLGGPNPSFSDTMIKKLSPIAYEMYLSLQEQISLGRGDIVGKGRKRRKLDEDNVPEDGRDDEGADLDEDGDAEGEDQDQDAYESDGDDWLVRDEDLPIAALSEVRKAVSRMPPDAYEDAERYVCHLMTWDEFAKRWDEFVEPEVRQALDLVVARHVVADRMKSTTEAKRPLRLLM